MSSFQQILIVLRKLNQAGYDCVFLEAPHVLPALEDDSGGRENARGWFTLSRENPSDVSTSQVPRPATYFGLKESMRVIHSELNSHTGFVATCSFSQGSVFGHILAQTLPHRIHAMILASGFCARHVDESIDMNEANHLTVPSLHLIGTADTRVAPSLSRELSQRFVDAEILEHDKGHIMPQRSAEARQIVDFLNRAHALHTRRQCTS